MGLIRKRISQRQWRSENNIHWTIILYGVSRFPYNPLSIYIQGFDFIYWPIDSGLRRNTITTYMYKRQFVLICFINLFKEIILKGDFNFRYKCYSEVDNIVLKVHVSHFMCKSWYKFGSSSLAVLELASGISQFKRYKYNFFF